MSKVDVKVVLLGLHDVGKTCLVERFLHGKFKTNVTATVGAAFGAKQVDLPGGLSLTLGIWDTAGAERYESMSKIYYRSAKAAIVCFDLTNRSSWEKVQFWINELKNNEEECSIYIVGTKYDLLEENGAIIGKAAVSREEINEFVSTNKSTFFQTSAKTNHNVKELFEAIARDYVRTKETQKPKPYSPPEVNFNRPPPPPPNTGCC
eukprot:CAMPEP_0184354288 /NCGR_PEP_ID=MMETSP1089-20130417/87102_1 /TAXON_ID=38269 ORGANISM="Gloeochaete wittrockiana, Strain SAG46.84" /NCGR_SAMPLE_ID=MMETSP1089 /ASSEMBLY_ACC=CAM_ASM_000445 /LENGTH=205 /DNA_ID=CAMNT_0026690211 /DNA_START=34 /DNA_END=651 /DNA_ORIENTATION=+